MPLSNVSRGPPVWQPRRTSSPTNHARKNACCPNETIQIVNSPSWEVESYGIIGITCLIFFDKVSFENSSCCLVLSSTRCNYCNKCLNIAQFQGSHWKGRYDQGPHLFYKWAGTAITLSPRNKSPSTTGPVRLQVQVGPVAGAYQKVPSASMAPTWLGQYAGLRGIAMHIASRSTCSKNCQIYPLPR